MSRLPSLAAVALAALAAGACARAGMSVSSHVERGLKFREYRTYDWGKTEPFCTGDLRLEKDAFFQDHFQGAVERRLAAKGLKRSTSAAPDLFIHYHTTITNDLDVNRVDSDNGSCFDDDCRVRVVAHEKVTLLLDLVDSRTNKLVWRGWAQDRLEDMLGHQDRFARKIDEAVRRVVDQLPAATAVAGVHVPLTILASSR